MLRAFPVRQFRVEQAVDGVDLAGRGPAGEFVDARLGDEQLAGLLVEPCPSPCSSPAFLHADVRGERDSYSPRSGLSSSHEPATPSASLAASSVTPARSAPPVDSRMESIASTAFAHPDSLSTRLRVCSASLRVCLSCRSSHSRNGSGNASRTRLLGEDAGLSHSSANCMDGSSLFVLAWPYARGARQMLARRVEDLDLERAEGPTITPLPAFARSAEQRCRPRARPRRTGRPSYAAT